MVAFVIAVLASRPAAAQQAEPLPIALDTVAAVDEAIDERGNLSTGVILDAVVSADLGHGFEAFARPFVQRLNSGEWNRQVWIAALRYQRPGPGAKTLGSLSGSGCRQPRTYIHQRRAAWHESENIRQRPGSRAGH